MAENKPEVKPVSKSSFSLIDPRDHFIGVAMRELLIQQIQLKQLGHYDIVANHAVRYADAVMAARAKLPDIVVAGGKKGVIPVVPNSNDSPPPAPPSIPVGEVETEHPKPIAERLGAQPALMEV
jgi:hypothetical protein